MMKRLLAAVLVLSMMVALVACGSKPNGAPDNSDAALAGGNSYVVVVKTAGGMAMEGVAVYLYADDTLKDLVDFKETDEKGRAIFELPISKKYAVTLTGVPKGYDVKDSYTFSDNLANVTLVSKLIEEENLSGATLGLGDVMYDFTVTTPGGDKVTLSKMLKEKDVVLLNFWYTTCSWCVKEFPFMEQAYQQYQDKVGIIALNPMNEADAAIQSFQNDMQLSFSMAGCPTAWSTTFGIQGYPTTIVVDRYGVICLIEAGGITSQRPFINVFEHFTAKDYQQKLFESLSELVTNEKPNVEMDDPDDIAAAINGDGAPITYRAEEGDAAEYTWPFVLTEKDGKKCIKSTNKEVDSSYAILYADVELKKGQAVGFDYICSSENGSDALVVIVDNEDIYQISGDSADGKWQSCYPWVATEDGTYEVALCYMKDEADNVGEDTVYVRNMRVLDAAQIDTDTYIPRLAASENEDGSFDYVEIVLNPADNYYHVGDKNGPLLLADLMNYTQFNEEKTVYEMVYDGDVTMDGKNMYDKIVPFCTMASNSALNGVCTVTKELAEYLMIVADATGFDEEDDNEWLKICKYFQSYGTNGEQLQDPIQGLAPFNAYKATLGKNVSSNVFTYNRIIMPRGFVAEFVPDKSGVYRITSHSTSQQGVDAWIFDKDRKELLTYEMDEREWNDDKNVSMVYYMEKGVPYYIDIAYWDVYETGTIPYDIEYIAPTHNLFRLCSPGYFTYDGDATGDQMYYLIQGGIDVVLKDGKYYEDLGGGKTGSLIYADFTGITSLFSNPIATVDAYNADGTVQKDENGNPVKIKGMIDMGGFDFSKTEEDLYVVSLLEKYNNDQAKVEEYLEETWGEEYDAYAEIYQLEDVFAGKYHGEGEDLTEEMRAYVSKMMNDASKPEMKGCVVVDERLAELLQMVMEKYTFENVDNAWLKLCYYYDHLGPNG
ncbi:MAG: redoxin domain-containing protein [Clostridia bacterium]|nr:redoxin domain-containing protein [Clostridia bacterium]